MNPAVKNLSAMQHLVRRALKESRLSSRVESICRDQQDPHKTHITFKNRRNVTIEHAPETNGVSFSTQFSGQSLAEYLAALNTQALKANVRTVAPVLAYAASMMYTGTSHHMLLGDKTCIVFTE